MLFSSTIFIFLFLPFVIAIYYGLLMKRRNAQNIFLLIMSLVFYAWGEPMFVFIMLLMIVANWYFGILVDRYREKKRTVYTIITLMVAMNLSILFAYKYYTFFMTNISSTFGIPLEIPKLLLPIGISFFTFHAISYVMDIYRQNGSVQKYPINVGLYICFFPQLVAGPIVRYETISKQINSRKETFNDFSMGVCRFIMGLAKKLLIANSMALLADKAFSLDGGGLSVSFAWLGAIAYAFQIFFDFSGYSDMALGLGRMFGFHFEENFNFPYISKTISEFWRRWHISLGMFFRKYVYFPMGGNRVASKSRLVFNLFVVWALTGIWHGANWTFIIWGLYYFLFITAEKLFNITAKVPSKLDFLKHIYVIVVVLIGWVLFRSNNITSAFGYLKSMFGMNGNLLFDDFTLLSLQENAVVLVSAVIFSMPVGRYLNEKIKFNGFAKVFVPIMYMFLFYVCICFLVKGAYNPFIYFNF